MNIFKRESISKFYDDSPPDIWKIILGDDLHYHVGWGDGDIFYNSIAVSYTHLRAHET